MNKRSRYLDQFFTLQCCGDVINAVTPLNKAAKEITEAMAVVRRLKPFFLKRPMEVTLVDLAAGNALTTILAAHLLPVKMTYAVDKDPRRRPGHAKVERFLYLQEDIFRPDWACTLGELDVGCSVLVSVHPCAALATRIVDLYLATPRAIGLVLMPCCHGPQDTPKRIPTAFRQRISGYDAWAWWLAERAGGDLVVDRDVLSPCNAIVVARKSVLKAVEGI